MALENWDKSNLLQFAVTEPCSGSSSRADVLLVASCCQPGCRQAKMPLLWQGEGCWSAPGLLCCPPPCIARLRDLRHSRYLVALALALSLVTPGGCCPGFCSLHLAVLHLFGAASFTCPSQTATVAVAGGQSGRRVLASPESSVSLSLGEALKAG